MKATRLIAARSMFVSWMTLLMPFVGAGQTPIFAPTPLPGWRLELVAHAPDLRHPSVVCTAPDGRIFVAEDPMDIVTRAEEKLGRILCLQPDGRRTVFATNLHAVFGLQYLEGKLYVLHNPKFSVFRDDQGVGRDRVELIEQTNPKPWALDWNDHVPANFRLAMDGRFYVAIGDKGLFQCKGRDGSEVNLHGGGILRLRPDGTQLEIFSTGVRNILDVALTADDDLFTYDNTDEHQWMGRLTHMVDGGFYGYPHDFIPRRPYTLWMMHDFGAGAATGALAYNEDALPTEYRGNLFLADFGKRQVTRVRLERDGASFRVAGHQEMFREVPEDFRPVGLAWSPDGLSLYICDWQHRDVKVKSAEVGRLWKLTWTGPNLAQAKPNWWPALAMSQTNTVPTRQLLGALAHPSHAVRLTAQRALARGGRRQQEAALREVHPVVSDRTTPVTARIHAIWALHALNGGQAARRAVIAATSDPEPRLVRQAVRQIGERRTRQAVPALRELLRHPDATIRFQVATSLGRIGDPQVIPELLPALDETDPFVRFAVFTAINRLARPALLAWPSVVAALTNSNERIREGAAFSMRETFELKLVDSLVRFLETKDRSAATQAGRVLAFQTLASLHHEPPSWQGEWWAYHPAKAPPPERTLAWAGTPRILDVLRSALGENDPQLRLIAVNGLSAARDTQSAPVFRRLFSDDSIPTVRQAALAAIVRIKDSSAVPLLVTNAIRTHADTPSRRAALEALADLGATNAVSEIVLLLKAPSLELRLAAIASLGKLGGTAGVAALKGALANSPLEERRAALRALAQQRDKALVPDFLAAWQSPDLRADALSALARLSDPRALDAYLEGLASADPAIRDQSRQALAPLRAGILPALERRQTKLLPPAVAELRRLFADDPQALRHPSLAITTNALEPADYERHALTNRGHAVRGQRVFFDESGVACIRCHAIAGVGGTVGPDLTLAGAQFSRAQLIESILFPSRAVREGYQQIIIETKDGEPISGALKADTADGVTLVDARGQTNLVPRAQITERRTSDLSLMPEGLHVGLSLDQFADLIAYMESRKADPRTPAPESAPTGFKSLLDQRTLSGSREVPAGTKRIDTATLGSTPQHWHVIQGILEHDGKGGDLWTEHEFGDFELRLEWRWPDAPKWELFPIIGLDSYEGKDANGKVRTERVLDAGDSGVLLRGLYKAQANLFCYPVGSGEVWEYRTDLTLSETIRRGVTPKVCADAPIGDWNRMVVTVRGNQLSVRLNDLEVFTDAELPDLPPRGPIGLQHEHGRIQFRNVFIKELP